MLISHHLSALFRRTAVIAVVVVGMGSATSFAQQSVAVLTGTGHPTSTARNIAAEEKIERESFTLIRNLISFEAEVDGQSGRYILDTGSPSLVINNRGAIGDGTLRQAVGSGGELALRDVHVQQFKMANRSVKNYWAVALDLRDFEQRTTQRIDGIVGYDLLNGGELRIDYGRQTFSVRKSARRPSHAGYGPSSTLRFELEGHFPIVTLAIGDRKYRFIIDTGAGANLVDPAMLDDRALAPTGRQMNIQGLDGQADNHDIVRLVDQPFLANDDFVAMDLSHLSSSETGPIAGIIGSAFLRNFAVGIDYRRRKLHLWEQAAMAK